MYDRPMPSNQDIMDEAVRRLMDKSPSTMSDESIRSNFSHSVETLFNTAYEIYRWYAQREKEATISKKVDNLRKDKYAGDEVKALLRETMVDAAKLEISHEQSRESRADKLFEIIVKYLLDRLGIPSESVTREDKGLDLRHTDLVIPDRADFINCWLQD